MNVQNNGLWVFGGIESEGGQRDVRCRVSAGGGGRESGVDGGAVRAVVMVMVVVVVREVRR